MAYASFWKRVAAYLLDYFITYVIATIIIVPVSIAMSIGKETHAGDIMGSFFGMVVSCLIPLLYYACMESSSWQATLGKKFFGLKVTDTNGQRISFWRACGRFLGMLVSSMILCIGYLICLWTDKKQCLHDIMASCLVVDEMPNEKRGCAIAVVSVWLLLVLVLIGIVAAIVFLFINGKFDV